MDSTSQHTRSLRDELMRVRQTADMLCTGHAILRDRYSRWALCIDLSILGLSIWLVALAFVDPAINLRLTPTRFSPIIWEGLLSVGVFFLSIVQLKIDWKGRADAHRRTLDLYAEVKREAGYILASSEADEIACRRVFSRYDMASAVGVELPENQFLYLKKKHRIKIAVSRHLDECPSSSITFLRLRFWYRDNCRRRTDAS